jgi:hypothetical protein
MQAGNVDERAAFWQGTAASYVDLHDLLPSGVGEWSTSGAHAMVIENGTVKVFGFAYDDGWIGGTRAVMWSLPCYADCSGDGTLTVADFGCFQTRFVAANAYADCNADGVLTVADFGCFQTKFVAGCP